MKKLLIGFFAASLMCVGTVASAATVTLVNKYDQPVQFVISQSSLYNPVWMGVLPGGERVTVKWPGYITPDFQFMTLPLYQSSIVYGCGHTLYTVNKLKVVAGIAPLSGDFGCGLIVNKTLIVPRQ